MVYMNGAYVDARTERLLEKVWDISISGADVLNEHTFRETLLVSVPY